MTATESWVQVVQSQSGKAATAVTGFLSATSRVVLGAVLMLIAFYFLLIDGHRLVGWLERVTPLPPGRFRSFLSEFRGVSRAVVISTVGTGAVQAAAALVGYLIARVPNAIFFTLVTFFMSFIPSVGAGSVALVVSVVLFIQGRVGWGIFMIAWGILVVGLIDNVVKPLLIKGGVEMHGAVVFFALLGGLAAFGAVRADRGTAGGGVLHRHQPDLLGGGNPGGMSGPVHSYQRGAFTASRKNAVLWPIHRRAFFLESTVSIFRRDSGVPLVRSSAGMRSRVRSSS